MPQNPPQNDWSPTCSGEVLQFRADCLREIRGFFTMAGFVEVETPLMSRDTVVDANLDPIPVELSFDRTALGQRYFLQTSPEFAMKRLIASGMRAIYQIGKVFRASELGVRHNPEFTMIEWYRVGDDHHAQMTFTEQLVRRVMRSMARQHFSEPFRRVTYDEAFERVLGTKVLALSTKVLRMLCETQRIDLPDSLDPEDRDGLLNLLLALLVEPTMGVDRPEFLYDYPASQAALSRVRNENPPVAERFELYWRGIELGNGYHELTDADELRRRVVVENDRRVADYGQRLPEQSRLLDAMDHGLPACAGVALGFDRLVMSLLGKEQIADVIPFPIERA